VWTDACEDCAYQICLAECTEIQNEFLAQCNNCAFGVPTCFTDPNCIQQFEGCIPGELCQILYQERITSECNQQAQAGCIQQKIDAGECCEQCGDRSINCASCHQDECINEVFSGSTQEACVNAAEEAFKTGTGSQSEKEAAFHKAIEACKITCEQRIAVQKCLEDFPPDDPAKCTVFPYGIAVFHQHECLAKIQEIHKDCTGANPPNPEVCQQRYDAWKKMCLYSEICVRNAEQKKTTCQNNCATALANAIKGCRTSCKYTIPWDNCFHHCHRKKHICRKKCYKECKDKLKPYHDCRRGCFNTCHVQRKICGRRCVLICRHHHYHRHHHHYHHHHHHYFHGKHHHHHYKCRRRCLRKCNKKKYYCKRKCKYKCKPLYAPYAACNKECHKNCIYNKWNCKDRCQKANYYCFKKCKWQAKKNNKNCLASCQSVYEAEVEQCKCELKVPPPNPAAAPMAITLSGANAQCSACYQKIVNDARAACPIAGSKCHTLGKSRTKCLYDQNVLKCDRKCYAKQPWFINMRDSCCPSACAGHKVCETIAKAKKK